MQQVNLYQSVLRKKTDPLTVERIIWASAAIILILCSISIVQWGSLRNKQSELATIKSEQQQLMAGIDQLTKELSQRGDDMALKNRLEAKEQEIKNKQNVLAILSGRRFGNTKGFAEQFIGLARQRVDGLWVTGLHIHSGGEKINLSGSTLKPEHVPHYLQKLANEPSFEQIEFQTFLMERPEKKTHIEFHLQSSRKETG